MADERDEKEVGGKEDQQQATGGQQSHESEYGQQGQPIGGNDEETESGTPLGESAQPPRGMETGDAESGQMTDYDRSGQEGQSGTGQADLASQSDPTPAGRTDEQDLDRQGEGFILQEDDDASNEQDESGEAPRDAGPGDPASSV